MFIESPANLSFLGSGPVEVTGTVAGPGAAVEISSVSAAVRNGTFTAQVPVKEGNNTITAVARNAAGDIDTASIQVTLDTTPPRVVIESPPDGFVTNVPFIAATPGTTPIVPPDL